MKKQVPEQKGKIEPNPMTSKQMTHTQHVAERVQELKDLRKGKTLDYHSPQKKR